MTPLQAPALGGMEIGVRMEIGVSSVFFGKTELAPISWCLSTPVT
jgi:hypothetical protein